MNLLSDGRLQRLDEYTKATARIEVEWLKGLGRTKGQSGRYTNSPFANRCIQIRMNALAAVPWEIGTMQQQDGQDVFVALDSEHPLVLMLKEVNPEQNGFDLMRGTEGDLNIVGRAYWWKVTGNNSEQPLMLQRLVSEDIELIRSQGDRGQVIGFRSRSSGMIWQRDEIIYFHTYHPSDPMDGLSLMSVCQEAIDNEILTDRYVSAFFKNNAIPPVIFTTEQQTTESDFQRMRRWFERTFSGAKNQHKAGIMDKGLKPTVLGYPVKDLALESVRAEARRSICSVLGVPPSIAGAWEAANYATAQEQRKSMYEDTIMPRGKYLEGVINAELVQLFDPSLIFRFKFEDVPELQESFEDKAKSISQLVRDGVITPAAGARELGFLEEDAGIGPMQTRIIDDDTNADEAAEQKSSMKADLEKWERKALKSVGKSVKFESDHIPQAVADVIGGKLGDCASKEAVKGVFAPFIEI